MAGKQGNWPKSGKFRQRFTENVKNYHKKRLQDHCMAMNLKRRSGRARQPKNCLEKAYETTKV